MLKSLKELQQSNPKLFYKFFDTNLAEYITQIHQPLLSLSDDPMKSKRFKINDLLMHIFNELPDDFNFTESNFKMIFDTLAVMHQTIEQAE